MNKFVKVSNTLGNVGLIINIIIFGGITVLNYSLLPTISNGLEFLLIGWFVGAFIIVGGFGGLGTFIGSLLTKSKIKIIYILLSLAITVINCYFFWQLMEVIK